MGIIEIAAAVLVLIRPHIGAYVIMGWLALIAAKLILGGHYLDVVVRDPVMAIGAFRLAKLSITEEGYKAESPAFAGTAS